MPILHLQPGPGVGLDTYIKAGPYADIVFGSEQALQIGRVNSQPTFSLMKFLVLDNEGGPIPPGSTINSAILNLWQWDHRHSDNLIFSYLLLRSWQEDRCTWNHAIRIPIPWEIPGAEGISDREQISEDPPTLCNSGTISTWVHFSLTNLFQKIVNNYTNSGFILTGTYWPRTLFWSSEYINDPTKRPILDIDYTPFNPFPIKSRFLRLNFP